LEFIRPFDQRFLANVTKTMFFQLDLKNSTPTPQKYLDTFFSPNNIFIL
jgi:hypothetical protein